MLKTLDTGDFAGKRVLCRIDTDVPFTETGEIADDNRLRASLATIDFILKSNPKRLVLIGHRGRPKTVDMSLTLEPVANYLSARFGSSKPVRMQGAFAGQFDLFQITDTLFLAENVRFSSGEQANDPQLTAALASEGDCFVFDAFAVAHRDQASTSSLAKALSSVAGLHVAEEVRVLDGLRTNSEHPVVFIIGGAKIEDKLPIIEQLAGQADTFLVGGAVANTFLKVSGVDVKQSLVQDEFLEQAGTIVNRLTEKLLLPTDYEWKDDKIVDIGPKTIMHFEDVLTDAKTVFWNGNLGKTEERDSMKGSLMIADLLAKSPQINRVVAGGDTVGFLHEHHLAEQMNFISTGGGAALEYLAGKTLPALNALEGIGIQ